MKKIKIPYKWQLIILLWFAYFLNQGDRQVFNVVIPLIKEDLKLSDVQIGLVATVFTLVYGILVPFAGLAGDLLRRKWIVFYSLLIFSLGTLFTGFSNGMILLIIFRSIATGAGESFYYPAATSLIGQFHQKTRAMALSIHQTSLYTGIVASGFIAGYIGENYGWRSSFYVFGGIGVLWSFVVLAKLKDSPTTVVKSQVEKPQFRQIIKAVLTKKTVYFLSLAFGAMVFVNIGYLTWMPTFLHEKYDMSLSQAGFSSMFYHHLFAFLGVMVGGKVSDHFAAVRKTIRMEAELIGLLFGAPFIYLMAVSDSLTWCYVGLGLFGFFRGIYDSNLFAALFDVIEPKYRASSMGLMLAFAFTIGSFAPVVLGWIKTVSGLTDGLSALSYFYIAGAILIFIAIKLFFDNDYYEEN
ncbi:MFS transporter [Marinilongibacter aquaticus]|uniref:MFS transporter n=1 Tax=Marinilongibacter aquaticus TaxID=2975157 RepID=UPI0021BD89AB|nr:MFS transporter [Marinilongibacter aquaticus]UBM59969.1 MFS transporter [Marinilongibacter aquaticus]